MGIVIYSLNNNVFPKEVARLFSLIKQITFTINIF